MISFTQKQFQNNWDECLKFYKTTEYNSSELQDKKEGFANIFADSLGIV